MLPTLLLALACGELPDPLELEPLLGGGPAEVARVVVAYQTRGEGEIEPCG
jgi:hypothetical protein